MTFPLRFGSPCLLASSALWSSLVTALFCSAAVAADDPPIKIEQQEGKAIVKVGDELFTEYLFTGHSKPILYPILGPTGVAMTRHYPMREGVDNEARDHPHHKSLWFTHDDVNGERFWLEFPSRGSDAKPGKIVQTKIKVVRDTLRTENDWLGKDGNRICRDVRTLRFGANDQARWIDFAIQLIASDGDVTFGDTKEGTMGIRIHPLMRLSNDVARGNHTAQGHAINSEGQRDRAIWGKRAKWVAYWAEIAGENQGIAIFDHPRNMRHPTWWHARPYGLVAANPFGIHDFEGKPEGTGNLLLRANASLHLRYRFLFHLGTAEEAKLPQNYEAFAKIKFPE